MVIKPGETPEPDLQPLPVRDRHLPAGARVLAAGEDIYAVDVYGSGTPGGCCGLDLGRELTPGDVVELEVEKIGVLRNTVGRPSGRVK